MESLPINLTDLIVIGVLLISALIAFLRGLVHEVLSIGAWVGAGLVTLYFIVPAQTFARRYIEVELAADIAAGVALFLLALIGFSIVSRLLSRRVQESSLGALDRFIEQLSRHLGVVPVGHALWRVAEKEAFQAGVPRTAAD